MRGARADHAGKPDYASADRAYIAAYGSLEDYRDGYQQGFEVGYGAGYARQGFNSELPAGGVRRRGAGQRGTTAGVEGVRTRAGDDRARELLRLDHARLEAVALLAHVGRQAVYQLDRQNGVRLHGARPADAALRAARVAALRDALVLVVVVIHPPAARAAV